MSPVMWALENPVWSTADRSNCYHCRFKHSLRYLIKMRPSLLLCSNSLWFVHKWVCTILAKKIDFYCLLRAWFWFGLVYSHTTVLRDGICKTEVSCKALCLEVALSEKKKKKERDLRHTLSKESAGCESYKQGFRTYCLIPVQRLENMVSYSGKFLCLREVPSACSWDRQDS